MPAGTEELNGQLAFTGKLTARMGAGNDTLILGTAGDGANGQVVLGAAANLIDGGAGRNLCDAEAGQFDADKFQIGSVVDPTS